MTTPNSILPVPGFLGYVPKQPGQNWITDGSTPASVPEVLPDGTFNPQYLYNPSWLEVNERPLLIVGGAALAAVVLWEIFK